MKKILLLTFLPILLLISCGKSEKDPCETITCENSGVCIDGTCECTDFYEGPNCSNVKKPSSIKYLSINIGNFPFMNGTETWDPFDGPDVYLEFFDSQGASLGITSTGENHSTGQSRNWTVFDFVLEDLEGLNSIKVWDFDDSSNSELMSEISFLPFDSSLDIPLLYMEPTGSNGVTSEIHIDYIF